MPSPTSRRASPLNRKPAPASAEAPAPSDGRIALHKIEGRAPEMGIRISLEAGADYVFTYSSFGSAALEGDQLQAEFGDWEVTCFFDEDVLQKKGYEDMPDTILEALRAQTLSGLRASKENGFTIEIQKIEKDE